MSLVISKVFTYDTDAGDYIQRVEGASGDNQALEPATRQAINNFVIGCKQDGIWNAIKASCILSGARTLNGALQPLVGTAPTNVGPFVTGDYVRKTGLVGNGSSKYLNSNRTAGADPLNNYHIAVFPTSTATVGGVPRLAECQRYDASGSTGIAESSGSGYVAYSRFAAGTVSAPRVTSALVGSSRSSSSEYVFRRNLAQVIVTQASQALSTSGTTWKLYTNADAGTEFTNARLAFYSIGESLDLALLDARVTALITAFGVAIP